MQHPSKILTATAYSHLVEEGSSSLDDPLGAFTSEFQLQAMVQDSNNESWSLLMDAVGLSDLHDAADILSMSASSFVLVVCTKRADRIDVPESDGADPGHHQGRFRRARLTQLRREAVPPLPAAAAQGRLESGGGSRRGSK